MKSPRTSSNNQPPRTLLRVLLIICVMTTMLVWNFSSFALQGGSKPAANLDQVRNGTADAPIDPPNWVNGNAGASNAHYREGESIPYRLVLTNLNLGNNTVKIEWDLKHSGVHAIDYITHYDRIAENVLPCNGVAGCNPASFTLFPIPAPSSAGSPVAGQPTASFNALPAAQREMTIYNGTITNLSYDSQGDLNASQSATRMTINFTAANKTVVIAWGGHIASRGDWGTGNSASGISGSPYHTRLIELNGSGGNQDRSLSAAAVLPPPPCSATGPGVVCENQNALARYTVTAPDASATYTWTIDNTNSAGSIIVAQNSDPSAGLVYADVDVGAPGSYTVTATPSNLGGSGGACPVMTTVQANTTTTDLQSGQESCPGGTLNFSTTASGGDGNFTYAWTLDGASIAGATNSNAINTTGLSVGTHTVVVTATGSCGFSTESTTFRVKEPTALTDPSDVALCPGGKATFNTTVTGDGTHTFTWKAPNGGVLTPGGDITITSTATTSKLEIANVEAGDAGTYTVEATGDCPPTGASQGAVLTVNSVPTVTMTIEEACLTSAKLKANPAGGSGAGNAANYTYVWSGPGAVNGATTQSVSVTQPGVYTVTVSDGNSCSGSVNGKICFELTSPAPSSASMQVDLPAANPPAEVKQPEVKQQPAGIVAHIAKLFSWLV